MTPDSPSAESMPVGGTPARHSSPKRPRRSRRILLLAGVMALAPLMLATNGAGTVTALAALPQAKHPLPAQFTTAGGAVLAGHVALFKASRSAGVSAYSWTLTGPGVVGKHFAATCSASTSQMETSFGRAGVMHVTVRIRYASGAVTTVAHKLVVKAAKVRPIAAKMAKQASQWILCARGPDDPKVQPVSNGGPPAGCQDQYFDGSIDAIGCFTVLPSYGKIPAPERALLCPVIKCTTTVPVLLPVLSKQAIRLNGIDITPATALVLDQNEGWMVSSSATASMLNGLLPLRTGKLKVAVYHRPQFSANLDQLLSKYPALATALNLSGLQVSGRLTVAFAHYASTVRASITLPASFTDSGGKPVTSSAMFTASDGLGLVLKDMLIAVPSANIGGTLEFDHLAICYQQHISARFCEKKTGVNFGSYEGTNASSWNATAKFNILGTEINAAPTQADPEQGIGFVNGQFDFAGADASFNPPIPLGATGVDLSCLQASLALNPTRLQGSVCLTAGSLVSINGQMFMVFASPSQPYTFTGHEVGATGMPTPTVTTFAIAVGGNVSIVLPVVGATQLASGYVLFYPGYLAAGGNVGINLNGTVGSLSVSGGVNGQFSLDNASFNVQGNVNVSASALGLTLSMGAQAVVSSVGIGACGTINVFGQNLSAGVGYAWGGAVNVWVGSCDLGPYIVIVTAGPGRIVHGPIHFHVPAGLPTEMVQVHGSGGNLTITGPGGIRARIGTGSKAFDKPFAIYRSGHTTYIAIIKPKAGVYTITPDHGSSITEVQAAQGSNGSVLHRFEVHVPHAA
ncbi:MAG TPA: hypothetical protein VEV63_06010 [Streptosporangiaceae bacterium]|nr:hypothetical protein [Streptosporangiaceae bacterium]